MLNGCTPPGKSRDFLSNPLTFLLLFCLPAIAIFITGNSAFGNVARTVVWTGALVVLGAACSFNAARCGRVHCYVTGPFFVVMAVVALSYGTGVLPLGKHGWSAIGLTILVGTVVLCCLPEVIFGKYRVRRAEDLDQR